MPLARAFEKDHYIFEEVVTNNMAWHTFSICGGYD